MNGRSNNCRPKKAGLTKSFGALPCPTRQRRRHNECLAQCLDYYEARTWRLFHLTARLRFHRDLPAAMRVLHVLRGRLFRAAGGVAGAALLRLASLVLPVSRAGGGPAAVG